MEKLNSREIKNLLIDLSEDNYSKFSQKLNPNIDNILGVRIPKVRSLAKKLADQDYRYYIEIIDNEFFEELMLEGFIIGYSKASVEESLYYIEVFIPKINNWSICDSFVSTLKIIKGNKAIFWDFIQPYFKSPNTYELRFAIVVSLQYYLDKEYINKILEVYKTIKSDEYYVEMALAWALSYVYIKFPDLGFNYIKENNFSRSIKIKTIQKIRDSRRVTKEDKEKALRLRP